MMLTAGRSRWQTRLDDLAEQHGVPGAVLGVLQMRPDGGDELTTAAFGVLNRTTHVSVTADSLFQLGSITKVWTATAIMQLVDEGRLSLDTPLHELFTDLRLADADAAQRITMRHLLTHTSGIDGDLFSDTGRGDDCLKRYVEEMAALAQLFPVGASWSYCNAGFVLAGRVIEQVTGSRWDDAMRDRLFAPLRLRHTVTLPEDALLHSAAVGHVDGPDGGLVRADRWQLPRSVGPAGLITARAADVLAFARAHLTALTGDDECGILSASAAAQMASEQVTLPDPHTSGDSWGIGWERFSRGARLVIGHDGNTIGQASFLRLVPDAGVAVVLLTNGGDGAGLDRELVGEVLHELAGVSIGPSLEPCAHVAAVVAARHTGRYERAGSRIEISMRDGRSWLRRTATGPLAALAQETSRESELLAADDSGDLFVTRYPHERLWTPVTFYRVGADRRYIHQDGRATPFVAAEADSPCDPTSKVT